MRQPDFIIGNPDDPYLRRWWIIPRNRWFNIYLHQFLKSDDDRALHDHPWWNVSILLRGEYLEVIPKIAVYTHHTPGALKVVLRRPFRPVLRCAAAAHRILLLGKRQQPVWSLFITGPVIREWGFHCPQGWRHWKEFVDVRDGGNQRGKGCE